MTASRPLPRHGPPPARSAASAPAGSSTRIALAYLDLDELPGPARRPPRPPASRARARPRARPARRHAGTDAVRELVAERTGRAAPDGPVRVLTHPRALGACFNPVAFYYALRPRRAARRASSREVTSTPVGRAPRLRAARPSERRAVVRGAHDKAMHVSPFQPMDRAPPLGRDRARADAQRAHREPRRGRRAGLRRDAQPAPRAADPRARCARAASSPRRLAAHARRSSTATPLGLKLRGAPHFRHPGPPSPT